MHDSDVSVPTVPNIAIPDAEYDAAWVAEAYDSFADSLYAYCRSLVREPSAAADAIQDTFVVTAFRLADLPDESLLRSWLHAVARNECLRAISQGAASALDPQPDEPGAPPPEPGAGSPAGGAPRAAPAPDETSPDLMAGSLEDANARALLRAALGGLDAPARDVMIMTWHGLEIAECARVLGLSHDAAAKLLFRGRDQLEESAGVLAVTRSGWRECAQLGAMLDGWDGQLTPALRTRLRQHVDRCELCGGQRRTGMGPALLLRLAPDSLRGMAAGASRPTAWVTPRLREQVLAAAFDSELESFERRAMVVRRAGPFRGDGFPVPLALPGAAAGRKRRSRVPLVLAGTGGTALLVVGALAALALTGNHSTGAMPFWSGLTKPATTSGTAGTSGNAASAPASASRRPSRSPSASATSSPTPTATEKPSSSATPSATAGPTAPAGRTPAATSKPAGSAAAAAVGVSPGSLLLTQQRWGNVYAGVLALINPTSSPMNWSVSLPSGLKVWGSQTSGQLPANSNEQTKLYIYYISQGQGQAPGQGQQSTTETITLQPGNVRVQVTIP